MNKNLWDWGFMPLPNNVIGTFSLSCFKIISKYKKTSISKPKNQRVLEYSEKNEKMKKNGRD